MLIRPKSDHFLPLSVFLLTDSLTHSCLVDLNEVNLADEDDYLMKAIDSLVEILKLSRGCVVQWLFHSGKISMHMIPLKITNLFLKGGAFWGRIEQTVLCLLKAINCQVSWWSLDVNENSKYQWLTFWSTLSLVNIVRSQKWGGQKIKFNCNQELHARCDSLLYPPVPKKYPSFKASKLHSVSDRR